MHTVTPYSIRCPNPQLESKNKNLRLDDINGHRLYDFLKDFFLLNLGNLNKKNSEKVVFYFSNLVFDDVNMRVHGYFCTGYYGVKTDIKDVNTGNVKYRKGINDAEIINHFFKFSFQENRDEGMVVFHAYRGNGIKTAFMEAFNAFFLSKTNMRILMNPISDQKILDQWSHANTKELKVIGFNKLTDLAEVWSKLGHHEKELTIKPKRRGTSFGLLSMFRNPESELSKVVESISTFGQEVKAVVELNGRKRTFRVGKDISNSACQVDVDEDAVTMIDGMPDFVTMEMWVSVLMEDLWHNIAPPTIGV